MSHRIWLLKTEPNEFSIDDLEERGSTGEPWNGIRNYQARNFLRDMAVNDIALIYHSACAVPAIVGEAKIIRTAYPDPEALNAESKYFDTKSTQSNNRWSLVDVQFVRKWPHPVALSTLKAAPALMEMKLIRQSRLSVSPVTRDEYQAIQSLAEMS